MEGIAWVMLLVGVIIGAIIMVLIGWILYATRSFAYSHCPVSTPVCKADDYYNDPGDALAHGANINNILFLNDISQMLYKRVVRNNNCVPGSDQIIKIQYPQYCAFNGTAGKLEGKQISPGSSSYNILTHGQVDTIGSCVPSIQTPVIHDGIPELKWDPNAIAP